MIRPLLAALLLTASSMAASPAAWLRAGRSEAREGSWSKAEELLVRAESEARLLDDPSLQLAARLSRVNLRLVALEIDSASALVPTLPRRWLSTADTANWLLTRSRVALAGDQTREGLRLADSALALSLRTKETPLRASAAIVAGRARWMNGDARGAAKLLKKARRWTDDEIQLEAAALQLESHLQQTSGSPEKSLRAIRQSLDLWRSAGDVAGVLAALPQRATLALSSGDSSTARETWDALAEIARGTGLPLQAIRALEASAKASPDGAAERLRLANQIRQESGLSIDTAPLAGEPSPP
ncbi:MAG: hypothetical protein H6686_02290 [Fibrobacteria bacterium]|nr:hypothetical protein [Fibrobacteria bacterium]